MPHPPITALPEAPVRGSVSATFIAAADAFVAALPTLRAEMNALADWEETTADQVTTDAAAAAAASASAINAPGTSATSTTSLAISRGSKTLTIQTGKALTLGQFVVIANTAAPGNYMTGQITGYDSGTGELVVNVVYFEGGGTFTAWSISLTAINTDNTPVGIINAWCPGYFGNGMNGSYTNALGSANTVAAANAHLNGQGWYVCDGAAVNVAGAPVFNASGRYLPNLTDNRFLMGGATAGVIGGSNSSAHNHTGPEHAHFGPSHSHAGPNHAHGMSVHTHTGTLHAHSTAEVVLTWEQSGLRPHGHPVSSISGSGPYIWSNGGGGSGTGWTTRDSSGEDATVAHGHGATGNAGAAETSGPSVANTEGSGTGSTGLEGTGPTSLGGTGTTSGASATENRPAYLSCLYIIKVF